MFTALFDSRTHNYFGVRRYYYVGSRMAMSFSQLDYGIEWVRDLAQTLGSECFFFRKSEVGGRAVQLPQDANRKEFVKVGVW